MTTSYKLILDRKEKEWSTIPELKVINWEVAPPLSKEEIIETLSSSRFGLQDSLVKLYLEMNGCKILWDFDYGKEGYSHEGYLIIPDLVQLQEWDVRSGKQDFTAD